MKWLSSAIPQFTQCKKAYPIIAMSLAASGFAAPVGFCTPCRSFGTEERRSSRVCEAAIGDLGEGG